MRHNFGNHSPFICGTRRERLWVEQERLRSSCSGAITPGGENSVAGRNALGEVGHVLDCRDDWDAYVGYVFQSLNTFIVNLAPDAGIGGVAEGGPIDIRNELPTGPGKDYDLVRAILRNPVEPIDKFRVRLR